MDTNPYGKQIPPDAYFLQKVGYPLSEGAVMHLRRRLATRVKRQTTKLAIDLRAVPDDHLSQTIERIFASKALKQ